jgi:hypothetical protein
VGAFDTKRFVCKTEVVRSSVRRFLSVAASASVVVGCAGAGQQDVVAMSDLLEAFEGSGQRLQDLGYPDPEIGGFVIEPPGTKWPTHLLATGATSQRRFYVMLYRRASEARDVAAKAPRTDPVFGERRSFVVSRNVVAVVQPARPATRAFVASVLSRVEGG